ncbi:YchJ family protein [Pseudodesulfovibrio sp.]|uniref:YchJ family protein n=1 Tax=Pseudodesulfovibrio sp. TaxID=2035812 RepID=UPI0026264DC0|nr:YchJ family protein [Pseudodesulfovibrio sp.]MDD3312934.1 YchJ family protein [Pseudodesulfovibrio sp.]
MTKPCPCGSGKEHAECCEPIISGAKPAPTAEALMRSRYTAYVDKRIEYLGESLAPETRKDHDEKSVREWADTAEWLGLEITDTEAGGEGDDEGVVEFAAKYAVDGQELTHRERSRFRRVDGLWRYVDGEMVSPPNVRKGPRVGRNDPCPCGSGKKYKKCCGR